jgi:Cadherin-like domain
VVGNTTFTVNAANGILNGSTGTHVTLSADAEFFGATIGANPATQTHIVTTGVIDTAGGSVTLNADGSFTYTPDAGFTGTDSFTYTLTDAGLDGNFATAGDNLTGTGTVTFNVEDRVWFIDIPRPAVSTLAHRPIHSPRSPRSMRRTVPRAARRRATSSTCAPALIPKPTASTCSTTRA